MKSVLIIGAGVAGYSAAYYLSKSGFKVTLAEAANNSGGRITALSDLKSGETIDNGQHVLMNAYHTFLEILSENNSQKLLHFQKSLKVDYFHSNQSKTSLNTGILPGKIGFALGFLMLGGISLNAKISIINLMNLIEKDRVDIQNLSCMDFLIKYNQSEKAIKYFWEPFILATMNCRPNIASAEILLNILKLAFVQNLSNSRLIIPATDLNSLLKPIEKYLSENNGEILYNCKIKKLIIQEKKCLGVETDKGNIITADYVISTVPAYQLLKIIPVEFNSYFQYLSKFEYSPIVSCYLWLNEKLMDMQFIATLGTEIQWIFNRNKLLNFSPQIDNNPTYSYSITISSAENISNLKQYEILDVIIDDLSKIFTNFNKSSIKHHRIITEKFATFKATISIEGLRPNPETILKNFYLAGDWTNTKLPATIESAALSGKLAANEIINLQSLS